MKRKCPSPYAIGVRIDDWHDDGHASIELAPQLSQLYDVEWAKARQEYGRLQGVPPTEARVPDGVRDAIERECRAWPYTMAETVDAFRWVAGVTGRVGLWLTNDVAARGRDHCPRDQGCSVSAGSTKYPDMSSFLNPADIDLGGEAGPVVYLHVPWEERRVWVDRAKALIRRVVEAEQWRPSAGDERAWAGDTTCAPTLAAPVTSIPSTDTPKEHHVTPTYKQHPERRDAPAPATEVAE
ncbi:hypothetical protein GCM10027600_16390 [Nocardioides ginsengisegetis]